MDGWPSTDTAEVDYVPDDINKYLLFVIIWHWDAINRRRSLESEMEGERRWIPEEAVIERERERERERESLKMKFDLITSLSVFLCLSVLAALVFYCYILRRKWLKKKRAER